jgi:hypothetical protein
MAELEFIWRAFPNPLPGMKGWVAFVGPYQYAVAHNKGTGEWWASVRFAKTGDQMIDLSGQALQSENAAKDACRRHWQTHHASQP